MSYDLHVLARRKPKPADLEAGLVGGSARVQDGGSLRTGGSLLLWDGAVHVELDGPSRIEREDVPDAAAGAVGRSGWQLALSVKPATAAEWPMELAVHLARAGEGVVYDPQQDAVVWPRGWEPRARTTREQRIEVVELRWYAPASVDPTVPHRLLSVLRQDCPVALPRRYGDVEPPAHRFEGDGADAAFASFWTDQARGGGAFFFWTAVRPCLHGVVSMTNPARVKEGGAACTQVSLTFDGRPFRRDPMFLESVVQCFVALASELDCIYAAAVLNRGYILRGSSAWGGGGEAGPLPVGDAWVGLPAAPTWLAWFGRAYAPLVRPAVADIMARDSGDALFVRLGTEPANADELAERFPPLPARLLARRAGRKRGRWLAGGSFTLGQPPPSEPAEALPAVGLLRG